MRRRDVSDVCSERILTYASGILRDCCCFHSEARDLAHSLHILPVLLRTIKTTRASQNVNLLCQLIAAVQTLSDSAEKKELIKNWGGIDILLSLLKIDDHQLREYLTSCLRALLSNYPSITSRISSHMEKIIPLISISSRVTTIVHSLAILAAICEKGDEDRKKVDKVRERLIRSGILERLNRVYNHHKRDEDIKEVMACLIARLAEHSKEDIKYTVLSLMVKPLIEMLDCNCLPLRIALSRAFDNLCTSSINRWLMIREGIGFHFCDFSKSDDSQNSLPPLFLIQDKILSLGKPK